MLNDRARFHAARSAVRAAVTKNNLGEVQPMGYFAIPLENFAGKVGGWFTVGPMYDQPGGGVELTVLGPISIQGAKWVPIGP